MTDGDQGELLATIHIYRHETRTSMYQAKLSHAPSDGKPQEHWDSVYGYGRYIFAAVAEAFDNLATLNLDEWSRNCMPDAEPSVLERPAPAPEAQEGPEGGDA